MAGTTNPDFDEQRNRLVDQIQRQGIVDRRVLDALRRVPREAFVAPELRESAYDNSPLPIGNEQTISQPFIVALMTSALELQPHDRVLEIGTGSGYAAAVLGIIAGEVYTVERHGELAAAARRRLAAEGFANVHVLHGDGTQGWPPHAPYDAIAVTASGPEVPKPLLEQLKIGGRLVIPVGPRRTVQELVRVHKTRENEFHEERLGPVRFVPLIGEALMDRPRRA